MATIGDHAFYGLYLGSLYKFHGVPIGVSHHGNPHPGSALLLWDLELDAPALKFRTPLVE
jgi:hypothetical protein